MSYEWCTLLQVVILASRDVVKVTVTPETTVAPTSVQCGVYMYVSARVALLLHPCMYMWLASTVDNFIYMYHHLVSTQAFNT